MSIKAYKGFDKNLRCRDFQYEVGKEYETERAELCEAGFHACENPLDCLNYYSPNDGCVYHVVEVSGDVEKADDDSKVVATKIKIGARLSIAGIVKGAIDFIFSKAKPTSGDYANAEVKGKDAIAAVLGRRCKARGALGCWLVLTERDDEWRVLGVQAVKVDGESIKADTWYELHGGKVVEWEGEA